MNTFAEVIDRWPSLQCFADDIGVRYVTAQLMRHRNSIAAKHWQAAVSGADARHIAGVTLDVLAKLAAEEVSRPPKVRRAQASGVRAA